MNRRGRPLTIEWQESAAELQRQYKAEQHLARRTRLHAFWLLRQGQSLREVSALLSVAYRNLQRWVAWYRQGGLAEVLQRTPGGARGQGGFLTGEQLAQLRAEVDTGCFHTAQAVATWIEQQWQVVYTPAGIYSLFRRLGIRKKVPRRQSVQADEAEQATWKKRGWGKPSEPLV
jgi:transposase